MALTNGSLNKIVNPDLAHAALHRAQIHGEFQVYVRLAAPDNPPSYIKVLGPGSLGAIKASIPCDRLSYVESDKNVLSVELRAHISGHRAARSAQ